MTFAMNSNHQNPPSVSGSHRSNGSLNSHLLEDVLPHDHQVALELKRLHELRHQVAAQEQKLQTLRQQAANGEGSHNLLAAEQGVMKSLIFTKEKELALALMKVAELTSQLEQLRRGRVGDAASKSSQKRIDCSGLLATCESEQHLKGSRQKAIPIKVIKENVYVNSDLRDNSSAQNAEEKLKSDRERGVRIIPIVFEKKAVGAPGTVVAAGHGSLGTREVTCNKTVLDQNFDVSVQNARDMHHNTDLSSKNSFSTDFWSSTITNNFSSDKGTEFGVEYSTADPKDIKTDKKSEKTAENNARGMPAHSESSAKSLPAHSESSARSLPAHSESSARSLPAHSESSAKSLPAHSESSAKSLPAHSESSAKSLPAHSESSAKSLPARPESSPRSLPAHSVSSMGNVLGDKKVEKEKLIPIQCSVFTLADCLSHDKRIHDAQSSFTFSKDNNLTKNLFSNSCENKPANITNNSSLDKKDSGLSPVADKQDIYSAKNVICDKMNDSYTGNFSSEKTDGSTLKTFSQSNKSFSDFSLSSRLGRPIRESFSSTNQAGQMTNSSNSSISMTKQHQQLASVGKSAIKNDRARFFMDMVREDDGGSGRGQPLLDMGRGRGFAEVKPSASSTGSSTTSRGRSSSSAIMSRFAPQPYGRSKSVDSGSLRVPMMSVHGALHREPSPEVTAIDSKAVTSSTTTPSCERNPPLLSSSTVLHLQTVTASPVQATVTKASQDRQQIAAVHGMHIPAKEATLPENGNIASQLSSVHGRPSYAVPTVSPSLTFARQKTADGASLEKSVPDSKLFLAKAAAPEKTAGDSRTPKTETVTVVVTGTALSQIDHSVTKLGQAESSFTSVINASTDSKLPTTSSPLVANVVTFSDVVPSDSVLRSETAAKMCSLGTSVCTPTELAAGSEITTVFSCTKPIANVKVSRMSSAASMSSDAKILPFSSMPASTRALQGNSLASEPSAVGFRTVSVVMKSASPPATALANSDSTAVHSTTGMVPNAQHSVSKTEDLHSAEEVADTPWDSNVKRLAHIYAVTIGGTVKSKGNLHINRNKVSEYAAGASNCAEVAPLIDTSEKGDMSEKGVPSVSANRREHSKHTNYLRETADGKSSVVSPAKVSTGFGGLDISLPSDSRGAVSPCTQHQQINVNIGDPSHSTKGLPQYSISDVAQVSFSKANVQEQSKIDTSVDSVNTALSVLLQNGSSGHGSPVRPSRLRTTISSVYRRKLGSGALDNYSQNMTLLYGDCIAKKNDPTSFDVQDSSTESVLSPPVSEAPMIEDLPRMLALDTLDGMPFYPRIGAHLICRENEISSEGTIDDKAKDQPNGCSELLKTGDVEVTVIANPVQIADLVQVDSAETAAPFTLASFSPPDAVVSSYIDDPVTSDQGRFISETPARPSSRRLFRKDGKPQRRVTFDAVSLLLNAALEGEKDLVIEIVNKIANPNHKMENGLSALHNAVCGGHADIVRYLVAFGCDVNATDNDGWTPLHCAASSNNLEMMQILVENGASILPLTISDRETPLQKCSRNLPGFEEAVQYLTDVARNLGVENDGLVYVTCNFTNVCSDELVLHDGDCLRILRKGDESEIEWWWAKDEKNAEGYIPQSLLALFPRIPPKWLK